MAEQHAPDMTERDTRRSAVIGKDIVSVESGFEQKHLLDYIRVVYKRRWLALGVLAFVLAAVAGHTFTATPIYEARAQLQIEDQRQNIIIFNENVEGDKASDDYYQTQYKILQSMSLAGRVLDALKLWDHPEFSGARQHLPISLRVRRLVRYPTTSVREMYYQLRGWPLDKDATPQERIEAFLRHLTVSPVKNSRLVDINFRSADPEIATKVANALTEVYIDQDRAAKFATSKDAVDFLGQQLAEQRKRVADSELALQRYREANRAVSLEDRQNIVVQRLGDLNATVTRAKTDRIHREALFRQLEAIRNDPVALGQFPAVVSNPLIQQFKTEAARLRQEELRLGETLGERHPDMVRAKLASEAAQGKVDAEIQKVAEAVRNEFLTAREAEDRLSEALEAQKAEALALNRQEIDYGVLQRDAESNQQIFQSLLQRTRETGISGELTANNIRVVDAAQVPREPVWPRTERNLSLGFLGGLLLAVGVALFANYMDDRITTPREVTKYLQLPLLGLLPRLAKADSDGNPLLNNGVPSDFAEAFRAVRTNVLFSTTPDVRSLVVTSTGPGEGKTTVAANLALGMALIGQRVILIDADMRKPRVHDIFKQTQEPGLSDVIASRSSCREAIRETSVPGLWVLPAGCVPQNPAELLSSKRFTSLLELLGDQFQWVIIDSPPTLVVTDSSILAHAASAVLFVVTADKTSRSTAVTAIEHLEGAKARFMGVVLNAVDLRRHAFFYGQYYRREYGSYYGFSAH
jgi:capsular exopolysaccharide synthesis family protein